MSLVLVRKASYEYEQLKKTFFEIMDLIGGSQIKKGTRVVIKPNLLAPAPPEKAVVTHPLVIRAAAEYVLDKGCFPVLSDSPATITGSFEKILRDSGISDALDGLDVKCSEFTSSVTVNVGRPFDDIAIAEEAMHSDVLINLPKLKTHSQMLLTLGVKNLFGCIVGMMKPEWHLRAGVDRETFARLLVHICHAVKPSFTIIDGILAMEGQGPGKSGKPKNIGILAGSTDVFSLDIALCTILGVAPESLLTNRIAELKGLVSGHVDIQGDHVHVDRFELPDIAPTMFGPDWMHGFCRRHLTQRPVCDSSVCKQCGECWNYCPAGAITQKKKAIEFDYDKCIRCYCCIEVCPHAALSARETMIGKIARKALKMNAAHQG
jgi:uncharacterized protein (DUF362 family)/Pyruvate/2-oxoacid:ferredoxin oxidoreductase delta subunit